MKYQILLVTNDKVLIIKVLPTNHNNVLVLIIIEDKYLSIRKLIKKIKCLRGNFCFKNKNKSITLMGNYKIMHSKEKKYIFNKK